MGYVWGFLYLKKRGIEYMGLTEDLSKEEIQEKLQEEFMTLEIKGFHYLFWIAFTSHSVNTIQDRTDRGNEDAYDLQLQLFKNMKDNLMDIYDDYLEKTIEGKPNYPNHFHAELNFQEVVILHDHLEVFCNTLRLRNEVNMLDISEFYLKIMKESLAGKEEEMYRLVVRYLMNKEVVM